MAEVLIGVIAEGILNKAISFASEEISLLWGVKDDTQRLATKLQMIQALLSDAENKNLMKSVAVQLWMKRLEDVSLDADNALDELSYEAIRQRVEIKNSKRNKVRNFFSSSNPLSFRHKMAAKIENINLLLDELYQEANGIGLRTVELVNSTLEFNEILQTGPFVDDSEIVGRNADVLRVVEGLIKSNDDKDLSVISIVGMPGQGKTTLAQLVYKNDKVVRHFDYRLWICVSDDFRVDRLLNEMLEVLMDTPFDMKNREAIVKKLKDRLNNKRFLLVLDDVWNESRVKWNCLRKCLLEICSSSGSKVMVTTRSEDVALTMDARTTHHLTTLSDEESWTLFNQIAFADGGAIKTPNLVSIGKRILKRCGGVPLAVKALGGLLYSRKDEREWLIIERSELWNSSIHEDGVLTSLRLSYNHLPLLSLKQCFNYCSLFQKDSIMEKDILIQLWMAQGFLNHSKENHMEMEDTGSKYLNVLLRNSLLQADERDDYGSVRTCKMHDLVHDLALDVSKNHCLLTQGEEVSDEIKVVNLSLTSGERILTTIGHENSQRLRTLFCSGVLLRDVLTKFKKLRVLILNCSDVAEFPISVGKLKHLRFLDVSKTKILRLPDSIVKLYNLQTLRLYGLEELPKKFENLMNLRHFYVEQLSNEKKCLLPGIGRLMFLRSIPYFAVSNEDGCRIDELGGLPKLQGNLKIYGLENMENAADARKADIEGKSNVDTLELCWSSRGEDVYLDEVNDVDVLESLKPHSNIKGLKIVGFHGSKFPSWMMEPRCSLLLRNLVKITFKCCNRCEQVPPLGNLPCLKIVKFNLMDNVSCIGYEFYGRSYHDSINIHRDEVILFPALTHLSLKEMNNLIEWLDFEKLHSSLLPVKVFPRLEELTIRECQELNCLPDMSSFTSLRKFHIFLCSQLIYLPEELGILESLEEIHIHMCHNLVEIPELYGLHSLRKLSIQYCYKLTCLPEGLQRLKSLEDLRIASCRNLLVIPSIQNLASLRWLTICDCENLSALPSGLEFCTSLEFLEICKCPVLLLEDLLNLPSIRKLFVGPFSKNLDYFPWPACTIPRDSHIEKIQYPFVSLTVVRLHGWPKLTCLPEQLQFSALTYLTIYEFEGLVFLPEWLGNIQSLQTISIWRCHNLMYLPSMEAMQSLLNLQKLIIEFCSMLEERCTQGIGPEWHKIAHIPEISINAYAKSSMKN